MESSHSEYVRLRELQQILGVGRTFIKQRLGKLPPPVVIKPSYRLKLYNLGLCKVALIHPERLPEAIEQYQSKLLPKGKKK